MICGKHLVTPYVAREVFATTPHGFPPSPRTVRTTGGERKDQADAEMPDHRRPGRYIGRHFHFATVTPPVAADR